VRDAVFGNVGTTVVFRVGPFDAEVLETVFMPTFTKEDIVGLDKRQIYLTLMIDGVGTAPFSAVTIPPIEPPPVLYRKEVIESSRKQFSAPRAGIEAAIVAELNASLESEAPVDARMKKGSYGPPGAVRKAPSTVAMQKVLAEQGREVSGPPPAPTPPRREYAPRPPREEAPRPPAPRREPPPAPRAQESRPPLPPSKSSEDLKSILRTMTQKSSQEKAQQVSTQQQSLKGALADVLAKNSQQSAVGSPAVPEKKPFEVPEDQLRAILKGQ
jgi:hypothetical protein